MSLQNTELYKVLIEVGATPDAASKAAESVADYNEKFHVVDKKLDRLTFLSILAIGLLVKIAFYS